MPVEAGFELRLRREAQRVASQHQQLDEFQAAVQEALARDDVREAKEALGRFNDALGAHFSLEEAFYFPAVVSHTSGLRRELAELTA